MKASELRIGNYVFNSLGEITTVQFGSWLDTDYIKKGTTIPLTEEWLLKFGFEKERNGCWSIRFQNRILFGYWSEDGIVNVGEIIPEPVKHVHQLQNLYFCLTGEELTMKE